MNYFLQRIILLRPFRTAPTNRCRLPVALMSEDLAEKDYSDYLLRMKDIVEYYENAIFEKLTDIIPDIDQRRKLHFIKNDLSFFNVASKSENFSLPPAATTGILLGYMYVLEGSSLGGAMIYKYVSRRLDISEQNLS